MHWLALPKSATFCAIYKCMLVLWWMLGTDLHACTSLYFSSDLVPVWRVLCIWRNVLGLQDTYFACDLRFQHILEDMVPGAIGSGEMNSKLHELWKSSSHFRRKYTRFGVSNLSSTGSSSITFFAGWDFKVLKQWTGQLDMLYRQLLRWLRKTPITLDCTTVLQLEACLHLQYSYTTPPNSFSDA